MHPPGDLTAISAKPDATEKMKSGAQIPIPVKSTAFQLPGDAVAYNIT